MRSSASFRCVLALLLLAASSAKSAAEEAALSVAEPAPAATPTSSATNALPRDPVPPSFSSQPLDISAPAAKDIVLVLDNSGSMKKNDPGFLAGAAVTEFISRLDEVTRLAIVVFDQDVSMPVSLTLVSDESRAGILGGLKEIDYSGLLTDSPGAMERAVYELKNNGRPDAEKMIVFMTDGMVDTGKPAADLERAKWLNEDLALDAAGSGIRIFGIAFTEAADFPLIQSLAEKTSGGYFRALSADDLAKVFAGINEVITRPAVPEPAPIAAPTPTAPPPQPVVIEVPVAPVESAYLEDRRHSLFATAALVVLAVTVVVLVLLLIRRGREFRSAGEAYVAEAYLNDIQGNTSQSTYRLGSKPVMIGRVAGKDTEHVDYVVIPQSTIGRRHALIEYKDFAYWIMDQGSINGTFVNDKPVSSEIRLKHGDRVRLHKCQFEFVMPEISEAGKTVVSQTRFTGKAAAAGAEAMGVQAGPDSGMEEEELFLDISSGYEESGTAKGPVAGEQETVVRAGSGKSTAGKEVSADDETLMPGNGSRGGLEPGSGDVTLMPGSDTRSGEGSPFDSDDETLMPGGDNAQAKAGGKKEKPEDAASGDEFFDITGSGKDGGK